MEKGLIRPQILGLQPEMGFLANGALFIFFLQNRGPEANPRRLAVYLEQLAIAKYGGLMGSTARMGAT